MPAFSASNPTGVWRIEIRLYSSVGASAKSFFNSLMSSWLEALGTGLIPFTWATAERPTISSGYPPTFLAAIAVPLSQGDGTGLPRGMCESDGDLLTLSVCKLGNASQRRNLAIFVEAKILQSDTADLPDCGRLHDCQPRAVLQDAVQMCQVPVIRAAIVGGVLAQRREKDLFWECYAPRVI
ncbi:hypothetical protein BDW67DRAFT_135690 [Aspergillus spinulosporus]